MVLRDYQNECVSKAIEYLKKSKKKGYIVSPTGTGKSIIIAALVAELKENVLVLQPSAILLEQNYKKYLHYGEATIYSASMKSKETSSVTFATLGSIKDISTFSHFKTIIIDECHLYPAKGMIMNVLKLKAKVLGLTATPFRLCNYMDGAKLKMLEQVRPKLFQEQIHVIQIKDIKDKWWSNLIYDITDFSSPDLVINTTGADYTEDSLKKIEPSLYEKVKISLEKYKDRKYKVVFVNSIEFGTRLSKELGLGIIHSKQKTDEREKVKKDFELGKLNGIVNVDVLSVGYDFQEIDCIILARPTLSLAKAYQQIGRGTRPHPNKKDCVIVDLVDTVKKFGKVENLIIQEQVYNLDKQLTNVTLSNLDLTMYNETGEVNYTLTIPFGQYRGKTVQQVPIQYLKWMIDNLPLKPELSLNIKRYLTIKNNESIGIRDAV